VATIRKRTYPDGTIRWQVMIRREGHKHRAATFHTRTDAQRWARSQEIEMEEDATGLVGEAHRHTVSDLLASYRKQVLPKLQDTTRRPYAIHLKYWEAELGTVRLAELHPAMIAERRDNLLAQGKSPATVNRYLASLASALTAGVKLWHWLPASPMRGVQKPSERGNERRRFLTEDELDKLIGACHQSESPDLLLAVLLAVTTGGRQAEILGLRWRDVDWERDLINLRQGIDTLTKGGTRSAALAGAVAPLLKARYDAFLAREALLKPPTPDPEGQLIFPSRVTRSKPVNLRRPFTTALARAGIKNFVWHDLRHSAASFLAKGGASLVEIGAVLGHRSANTSKRYAHLVEGHVHDLTRAMADRLLPPAAPAGESRSAKNEGKSPAEAEKNAKNATEGPNSKILLPDDAA